MSQDSERAGQKRPSRVWRIAKTVGIGAVLLVTAFVVIMMVLSPRPENALGLGGSLKIEADPGVEVYIGNKHVGTGSVELTWDELLGTPELQPLATLISSDAPSPNLDGMGAITAEALGGKGSEIIWKENAHSTNSPSLAIVSKQILLRRSNGDLDLISVIDGELTARTKLGRRFLIPVRLRSTKDESVEFVCAKAVSWTFHPDIDWVVGIAHSRPTPPPDEVADEIGKRGLWKPKR